MSPRIIVVWAALALAIAGDAWFIGRPQPHGVAEFSPFTSKLGREELILVKAESRSGPLLSHAGGSNEAVDIFFERGALSTATRGLKRAPPGGDSAADHCRARFVRPPQIHACFPRPDLDRQRWPLRTVTIHRTDRPARPVDPLRFQPGVARGDRGRRSQAHLHRK